MDIFKKLAHEDNKCVIIVTHSPDVCAMVDQVYDLKKVKADQLKFAFTFILALDRAF